MSKGVAVVRRRYGFTMVELMVVITIMMVLIGLVVVGFNVVGGSAKRNSTKVALETARTMLNEVEAFGAGQRIKAAFGLTYVMPYPTPSGLASQDNAFGAQIVFFPADPSILTACSAGAYRIFYSAQNNRKLLEKLPQGRTANLTNPADTNTPPTDQVVVLLDGWGNPILFVPAGGMVVYLSGIGDKVVTSGGVINVGDPLPANARPFFVSAGPDGIFNVVPHPADPNRNDPVKYPPQAGGDDNLYSFEN